jgi:hypothetical protein
MRYLSFTERLTILLDKMVYRIRREVPSAGNFPAILEFVDFSDAPIAEIKNHYSIRIFKMSEDIVADPSKRYVEIAAYPSDRTYKAHCIYLSGTKEEIIHGLCSKEAVKKINELMADMKEALVDL